jgi:hypothetical protein
MGDQQTERHQTRQQHKRVVVWGCDIHHTPRGQECQGCADQDELFPRSEAPRQTRRMR